MPESTDAKQPREWLLDLVKTNGTSSQLIWEKVCESKDARIAPFAMLWNAASLLTFAETTKVVVTINSVSVIMALIRWFQNNSTTLLWVEDANRAIKWAELAQTKEPRYSPLATQIIKRATLILPITQQQAQGLPNYRVFNEKDAYNFYDADKDPKVRELLRRGAANGLAILECVKSLANNEPMFEDILTEAAWTEGQQAVWL
jgi:hypothetical protein